MADLSKTITPMHDYLLVQIVDESAVMKTADVRDSDQKGIVLAVGPGRQTVHGEVDEISVKKGDVVYWEEQAEADTPPELKENDPKLALVKYSQLTAKEKK